MNCARLIKQLKAADAVGHVRDYVRGRVLVRAKGAPDAAVIAVVHAKLTAQVHAVQAVEAVVAVVLEAAVVVLEAAVVVEADARAVAAVVLGVVMVHVLDVEALAPLHAVPVVQEHAQVGARKAAVQDVQVVPVRVALDA